MPAITATSSPARKGRGWVTQEVSEVTTTASRAGRVAHIGTSIAISASTAANSTDQVDGIALPSKAPTTVVICHTTQQTAPLPTKYQVWVRVAGPVCWPKTAMNLMKMASAVKKPMPKR